MFTTSMIRPVVPRKLLLAVSIIFSPMVFAEHDYDPDNAAEINEVCAGCHDEFGQGGKQGKYPRIAGMTEAYLERQLLLFQDRERPNMPMVEHVEKRQMPLRDIKDISIYLSKIKLKTRLPPVDESEPGFDAYARLQEAKHLMQVPRAEGNIDKGGEIYAKECRSCHGRNGEGKENTPQLSGQYIEYLWRQVDRFLKGERIHDEDEPNDELLKDFSRQELQDIFAWLSVQDD